MLSERSTARVAFHACYPRGPCGRGSTDWRRTARSGPSCAAAASGCWRTPRPWTGVWCTRGTCSTRSACASPSCSGPSMATGARRRTWSGSPTRATRWARPSAACTARRSTPCRRVPRTSRSSTCSSCDLQDVGSRYYTFVWTAVLAMRACASAPSPVKLLVLDRPNPLGGDSAHLEGHRAQRELCSFVGLEPIPVRHGLTVGEIVAWRAEVEGVSRELVRVVGVAGIERAAHAPAVGPSVRHAVAEHADVRDRARLPGRLPRRGDEPLRGQGHHAPVRDRRRAVDRRRRGWRRSSTGWRCPASARARSPSFPRSRSTRGRSAVACRST